MMKFNIISLLIILCLSCPFDLEAQVTFKLDSIYQYSWSEGMNDWNINTRDLYTYDNGGTKETKLLRLSLNDGSWENFYQYKKTYSGTNKLTENIQQSWDGNNWQNASRDMYTYDESNNKATFKYAIYSGDSWLTFNESYYSYNNENDITEEINTMYDYVSMSMVNFSKLTYNYSDGLLDYEILEEWSKFIGDWEKSERTEYSYNTNGYPDLIQMRNWGVSSGEWSSPYVQNIFSYNGDNFITEVVEQVKAGDEWQNSAKTINTYDANNNILEILSQEWNSANSLWENVGRQLRTFDANNNETELIFETWDNLASKWQGVLRQVKYWSPAETLSQASVTTTEVKFSAYPNPVTDYVNVKIDGGIIKSPEKVTLYDVFGNRIKSKILIHNDFQMSMKNQSAGIYFLKLNNIVYKIVKK